MTHEFQAWPKTARLFRDMTITEKIDGTNAAIVVSEVDRHDANTASAYLADYDAYYTVAAQSRKRLITPEADNFGFAAWVYANAADLVALLGTGLHFGEWWGSGIQRGYGLAAGERRFSLFNTDRYEEVYRQVGGIWVEPVPVLYQGPFDTTAASCMLGRLAEYGSEAAPGFANAEGICVYHHASRQVLKATLDANDAGKWEGA